MIATRTAAWNDTTVGPAVGKSALWLPLACAWLLALMTFSVPGREGPVSAGGLDPIALAKVASRVVVLVAISVALLRSSHSPRRGMVLSILTPLGVFIGWAILSAAWSPLKAVSLGQIGGWMASLAVAAAIGIRCNVRTDTSRILFHATLILSVVAFVLLAAHLVAPEMTGLNRDLTDEGSRGLMHPTSAGATAALGLMILVTSRILWGWPWTRILLIPGLLLHGTLIVLAASRTSLGVTILLLAFVLVFYVNKLWLAAAVVGLSSLVAGYLAIDPGFELIHSRLSDSSEYLQRDESATHLFALSGRTDLWEAIWMEYRHVPLHGCGYFVTARNGAIDVWSGPSNRTAHNVVLQVLASTGLIGLIFWTWGVWRVFARSLHDMKSREDGSRHRRFFLVMTGWYAGWGMLCASFMGPVQPESIVFFCLFGLALGNLRCLGDEPLPASQEVQFARRGVTT